VKLDLLLPWRRAKRERELDDEIRAHLALAEADRMAEGESPGSAAEGARREFGNVALVKETTRGMWSGARLETLAQDVRLGLRMLRRSPGSSALAVLCLMLGIGSNAAVLGWIEGILLRPYPLVPHQERLVALAGTSRGQSGFQNVSWPDLVDFREGCSLCDAVIAEKISGASLATGDRAEWAVGSVVSANYFDALGVRPMLGRGFEPAEDSGRNAHPVVVISHRLWTERFNAAPGVVGRVQMLNGTAFTIVGVAPEGFYGTFVGYAFQFWAPASMQAQFDSTGYKLEDRGARWIEGWVKLKPGVSRRQAEEEMAAVARRLENDYPGTNRGWGVRLLPLWRAPFNAARPLLPSLGIGLAVAVLVLVIACANVSNLMLVKAFGRRDEMTLRLALGSGRARLVRHLLVEGLILSLLAAGGGLVVAVGLRNAMTLLLPRRGVPVLVAGSVDGRVLLACAGVCLVATLLFALVPALRASEVDLATALKSASAGVIGTRRSSRIRSSLVLIQVSLSFLLLVGAGLLLQSLHRLRTDNPGFSTDGVLTTAVTLFQAGYDKPRARVFEQQLLDRVRGLGGVTSAALSRVTPFSLRTYSSTLIAVEGYQPAPDERPSAEYNEVSPDYFAAMGIPLVAGREFTRSDDENAASVAVVNEPMADLYFRGGDPVGQRFRAGNEWRRVVGVAKLSKYQSFFDTPKPFFYVPLAQAFSGQVALHVRIAGSPAAISAALTREMHAMDPNLPTYEVITLREHVNRSAFSQRVSVVLLGAFGGLALLLAAVGLYGVMSYAVVQSTRDLGLRMALGASASRLLGRTMSRGLALTAFGVVLGAAAALGSTRLMGYLLYRVSPRDPLTFGLALLVMAVASVAACLIPAWRATRIDPVRALRD
jgi:macrolide transport system ATP-binding/permease protein